MKTIKKIAKEPTPHDELKELLHAIRGELVTVAARIDAIEPELSTLKRIAEAAATVAAETHAKVNALHDRLLETTDRHGARLYALERSSNGKAH